MPFSGGKYSPELIKHMRDALDLAWAEMMIGGTEVQRQVMASRIMAAVDAGELNPEKLRLAELGRSS
jgi:hypothetical protein